MGNLKEQQYRTFVFDRRVLLCVSCVTCVSLVTWIVILFDTHWFLIDTPQGIVRNSSQTAHYRTEGGPFTVCRTTLNLRQNNDTSYALITSCSLHDVPYEGDKIFQNQISGSLKGEIASSVMSVLLMIMSNGFSVYSLRHSRYMYKRLAAVVLFITAGVIFSVMQLVDSIKNIHMAYYNKANTMSHSFSYLIGWMVFSAYVVAAFTFAKCSGKKKKKGLGLTEEEALDDEPKILGR